MAVSPQIIAIIGPTGSGKSDLALSLARATGAEILSVDSMQVYRGMDIGTAKPSRAEQAQVRHHLIDVAQPDEPFTVARFVEMADAVITAGKQRGTSLIAVGGTPLYFKALFQGLFQCPGADEQLREKLRSMSNQELHRKLIEVDASAANRIHVNDSKRLVRALEVHELTGRPISSFQTEWEAEQPRHEALWIGLHWEKPELNRRLNARVKTMIEAGWVQEVRGLRKTYGELSQTAGEATGYAELIEHVRGSLTLEEAIEQIKIATRQLARRQLKWFRRFPAVKWLEGERPLDEKVRAVMEVWK